MIKCENVDLFLWKCVSECMDCMGLLWINDKHENASDFYSARETESDSGTDDSQPSEISECHRLTKC